MSLDYSWLANPLYEQWLWQGVVTTISLSCLGIILMFILGVAGAACLHFKLPLLDTIVTVLVELFRNTPPLVQLFFLYFMLTQIGLHSTNPITGRVEPLFTGFTCVVLSLGLYNGAIAVEIVRSGLLAVPHETVEGARALGYSRLQTFIHVELPISLRLSVPTMTNNIVSLIKTSSQASLVAVADILYGATQIMLVTFRNLEVMILVWVLYVFLASASVVLIRLVANRLRVRGYGAQRS